MITEITGKQMRDMLDVNVVGLTLCTSNSVRSMKERGVNDGHIFNLNRFEIYSVGIMILMIYFYYVVL